MSISESAIDETCRCWSVAEQADPGLLRALSAGPFRTPAYEPDRLIAELRRERVSAPVIYVGTGTCGLGAGAGKTLDALRERLRDRSVDPTVEQVGCIGLCSEEPIVDVQLPGRARVSLGEVTSDKVPRVLETLLHERLPEELVLGQFPSQGLAPWPGVPAMSDHPFLALQRRWVLANCGIISPTSIDEYIARGGYSGLYRIMKGRTPDEVIDTVERSGLRGRGGAGFPTARKWRLARDTRAAQKYLVCNADEGDPGAFMDRAVAESDPHRLVEGMIVAAYAIGASMAVIYIRAEYPLAIEHLRTALHDAREYGLLGENILDSGFSLHVSIKMGAGAFVCGEETALIHSIEGRRGMPRPRPPYPSETGLFGCPTVINNVETLANVPTLLRIGPEAFAALGTDGSKGTKVFALSGMVRRTGLVEVPMGTTLHDVVFRTGGGIIGGKSCKGVQIGGPSGGCIPVEHLGIPCDYEALKSFGAIMGSGGLVVLDENTCMVDLAKFFMEFIQNESCGKCVPCRVGTRRMLEMLQAITRPRHKEDQTDALLRFQGMVALGEFGESIRKTSLCGLGQTAPNPVLSTLRWFREEYEAHLYDRHCPAGACRELVGAPCQNGCPVGTEVWRYVAHTGRGEYEEAYRVIRQANPFPSVCARVCTHPCEEVCRAGTTGGEPIAIRALKRFLVDRVEPSSYQAPVIPASSSHPAVAVVGAGPAGLTAAHQLSCAGNRVTVFERENRPGGMLVCAIPEYRLPREKLEQEIGALLNPNIDLQCGKELGRDFSIDTLLQDGYRAVYVATGSHRDLRLGIPGEEAAGVLSAMRFLKAHNLFAQQMAHGTVGIIGGGNSAVDAARVAIRQRTVTDVTIYYRRTRADMPAYEEEFAAAIEEGVRLVPLVTPVEVVTESGRLAAMRFVRNRQGEPDESGRRRPIPVDGSEHEVALDTLIVAISEKPEVEHLDGLTITERGTLVVNQESCSAGRTGVFAGGDVVTGSNSVIDAIAAGKNAAVMIQRYLVGKQLRTIPRVALPSVYVEPPQEPNEGETDRVRPRWLPPGERRHRFCEVEAGIDEQGARREARRCLRCDIEFTQPV